MDKLHFLSAWWCEINLLESDGHFALVDTGRAGDFSRIAAYLKLLGVKELDFILVSHFHNDHFGSVCALLDAFPTGKVYVKPYSNVENVSDGGGQMSDEQRGRVQEEYLAFLAHIRQKSELVLIYPEMPPVMLGSMRCTVYNADNILRKLYEDPESEYRQQYIFNENNNSAIVYLESANGASALLPGDCYDEPLSYLPGRFLIARTAQNIGKKVDVYKLAHHGCGEFTSLQTAEILRPDYVLSTGEEKALFASQNYKNLVAANPAVQCMVTQNGYRVFTMAGAGRVTYETIPET